MSRILSFLFTLLFLVPVGACAAAEAPVKEVLAKTGTRGGICLVIGAKSTASAKGLAAASPLYVQVLQPDAKLAAAMGAEFAAAECVDREKLGLRPAAFLADDYSSDLLNLILVEDAAAVGNAKLADLCRILVPNGCVAVPAKSGAWAAEAGTLKMQELSAGGWVIYRKPGPQPVEWKVCDMLKWKAGPGGLGEVAEIEFKDGFLSYADRMENEGDLTVNTGLRIVRDAYNGRTISRTPLGERMPDWYAPRVAGALASLKSRPEKYEERGQGGGWKAVQTRTDGKLDLPFFGGHCFPPVQLGKYVVYHYNIWVNTETNERSYPQFAHPACQIGHVPLNGILYNFPSPKPAFVSGELAIAAADIAFDHEPGGKVLKPLGPAPRPEPAAAGEWTMFRADAQRRNVCAADPGDKPALLWDAKLGLGGAPYGIMCGERTGVTQAVTGYGLVFTADIDAERVVAINAADGKTRWSYHVGSRVDYPPTIYNGLCLFAARDGWVHCLDAKTGAPVYRLLIPSRERLIGWHDKLGNLWPSRGDVLVFNGVAYASAGISSALQGGVRAVAFKPESGEVLWRQCYSEEQTDNGGFAADLLTTVRWRDRDLLTMCGVPLDITTGKRLEGGSRSYIRDVYLDVSNSLSRTMADLSGLVMDDGKQRARLAISDGELSVAHGPAWGGVSWESYRDGRAKNPIPMSISGKKDPKAKEPLWKIDNTELVADDILLTPKRVYIVGHYQRVKKGAELWVLSRDDGKVINTIPLDGYPAFQGMSAANGRLYIATREGRLLCYGIK